MLFPNQTQVQSKTMLGHLAAWFCIIVWGTTFISSKILLDVLTPVELLIGRFVIGYLMLILMYPKLFRPQKKSHEWLFLLAGLSGVTFYFLLENIALQTTLASNVSIIVSAAPFFTAFFVQLVFKETYLNRKFFLGFAIAMLGIALISLNGKFELEVNLKGDLLALLASACWGIYSTVMRKISEYGYHTIPATRRVFMYGILGMIPIVYMIGFQWKSEIVSNPIYLFNMLFLGISACALCFVFWNYALKVIGAVRSGLYIYMVPVVTIITSAIVLKEEMTIYTMIGALLTVSGLFITQRKKA